MSDAIKVNTNVLRLPSSYSLVTAERMLGGYFGVSIDHQRLKAQIGNPKTFYHALLYLPARHMTLALRQERCRDVFKYGQYKLIHYLFSGETSKDEGYPGKEMRRAIGQLREDYVALGRRFVAWSTETQEYGQRINVPLRDKAESWQRTVEDVYQQLSQVLADRAIALTQYGQQQLRIWLLDFAASVPVFNKDEIGLRYEQDTIVERSLVGLYQQQHLQPLSSSLLSKIRPQLKHLDDKLLSAFEGMDVFNQSSAGDLDHFEQTLINFEKEIATASASVGRKLFDYYRDFASDRQLVTNNTDDALSLGAEDVTDDYVSILRLGS